MLDTIKNLFGNVSNTNIFVILLVSSVLLAVAVYVYMNYIQPRLNPTYVENKEILEDGQPNEVELYYFYTNWCPYCKKAKPEWEKLKEEYENKNVNGNIVYFREIDCEKDEKTPDQFKVEGYPTIKLVANGKIIEYDAKPNYETLVEFLNTSL